MKVGPGLKFMLPCIGMDPTKKTPKGFCLGPFLKKLWGQKFGGSGGLILPLKRVKFGFFGHIVGKKVFSLVM